MRMSFLHLWLTRLMPATGTSVLSVLLRCCVGIAMRQRLLIADDVDCEIIMCGKR